MAGRIRQAFIDRLLERISLSETVSNYVSLKKAGKDYLGLCPFHNEKTPSFTVSETKGFYYCFGCHAKGNAIDFVMEQDGLSFPDAVEKLASQNGMEVEREQESEADNQLRQQRKSLYSLLEATCRFFETSLQSSGHATAASYLTQQRKLSPDALRHFRLGYAPNSWDSLLNHLLQAGYPPEMIQEAGLLSQSEKSQKHYDRFRDRVMFPIRNIRGQICGFGGRLLNDGKPKYLNSPETPVFHKQSILYGLFESLQQCRPDFLMLVEGYLDVISLHQAGIHQAVAALGTAVNATHYQQLFKASKSIIICMDGDAAGRKAAWKALENALPVLKEGMELTFLFLEDGLDPDTFIQKKGADAFRQALTDQTQSLEGFMLDHLTESCKPEESLAGKSRMVAEAKILLDTISNPTWKALLAQALSQSTGVNLPGNTQASNTSTPAPNILPQDAYAPWTPEEEGSQNTEAPTLVTASEKQLNSIQTLLALLIMSPKLAIDLDIKPQQAGTQSGLLQTVISSIHTHQLGSTTQLLAFFHGQPEHETLMKQCSTSLALFKGLPEKEIRDNLQLLLQRLNQTESRAEIELKLKQMATRSTELSKEERNEYLRLLQALRNLTQ